MVFHTFWIVDNIILAIKCLKLKRKLNYRSSTRECLDGVQEELLSYYKGLHCLLKVGFKNSPGNSFLNGFVFWRHPGTVSGALQPLCRASSAQGSSMEGQLMTVGELQASEKACKPPCLSPGALWWHIIPPLFPPTSILGNTFSTSQL